VLEAAMSAVQVVSQEQFFNKKTFFIFFLLSGKEGTWSR